jgi:hypothetical protein
VIEPSAEDLNVDQRLSSALHQTDVPMDLSGKIAARLQLAADAERESHPTATAVLVHSSQELASQERALYVQSNSARPTKTWHRRRFIQGIVTAAGIGGIAYTYRQLTRPLPQSWLLDCSLTLLGQVHSGDIQLLTVTETLISTPTLASLRHQTRDLIWTNYCHLAPPPHVKRATAFGVGNNIWAFELLVPRRVEGLSDQLTRLSSHSIAAMAIDESVLFLAGSADLRRYILSRQAI